MAKQGPGVLPLRPLDTHCCRRLVLALLRLLLVALVVVHSFALYLC
jgi:hypothetical protein